MKAAKIIYWVVTILVAIVFLLSAGLALQASPEYLEEYRRFNYPLYLPRIHGFLKLAAVIALLIPRRSFLKHWAYAGLCFTMVFAALAHHYAGEFFIIHVGVFFLLLTSYYLYMEKMNFPDI